MSKLITQFLPITDEALANDKLVWVVGNEQGTLYQPTVKQLKKLAGGAMGIGTINEMAFWNTATTIGSISSVYWDSTNKQVKIEGGGKLQLNMGIQGADTGDGARFVSLDNTLPQLSLRYDNTTNYANIKVDSAGLVNFNAFGSGAGFKFSQPVTIGSYRLPIIDGTANQVLQTDGAGVISWGSLTTSEFTNNYFNI